MINVDEIISKVEKFLSETDDDTLRQVMIDSGYDFYKMSSSNIFEHFRSERLVYRQNSIWSINSTTSRYISQYPSITYPPANADDMPLGNTELERAA